MKTAYVHTKCKSSDGSYDSYRTQVFPLIETDYLPRKGQTVSGYGKAMPTRYMIKFDNKWHRVKVACFSNAGSAFIGKTFDPCLTVQIED